MAIDFVCACGKKLRAKDEHAGRQTTCPQCGEQVIVPAPQIVDEAPAEPVTTSDLGFVARLDSLERENLALKRRCRRLLWGGAVSVLCAAILSAIPGILALRGLDRSLVTTAKPVASLPKTIEAEAFVLRDSSGKVRGEFSSHGETAFLSFSHDNGQRPVALSYNPNGLKGLTVFDGNGKARVSLGMTDEGPRLALLDQGEKIRMDATVKLDGWARLNVFGEEDLGGVNLSAHGDGQANIGIFAPEPDGLNGRKVRFGVRLDQEHAVNLLLKGKDAPSGILLSVGSDDTPGLDVINRDGEPFNARSGQ